MPLSPMTDEPTDQDGIDYENAVIEAHKNNPPRVGERVQVFGWRSEPELLGVGERVETWWSGFYYQHMSRVRLDNGQELTALLEKQLRPVDPDEIRKTFRII